MMSKVCSLYVDIRFKLLSPPDNRTIHQAVLKLRPFWICWLLNGIYMHGRWIAYTSHFLAAAAAISDGLLRRLQSVQNAAARLVTGARRCDHITPVLRQLHWLPVRQRVVFKIAGLVHQSLVGLAPAYLADDCRLLSDIGRCPLRSNSNDIRKLLVLRTHNKLGDRSFSAAGPRLCNDLPPGLRRLGLTFDSFRQSLKTHLFGDRSA